MTTLPPLVFSLGAGEPVVEPGDRQWMRRLPITRHAFGRRPAAEDFDRSLSYGDLFSAIRDFLISDGGRRLHRAVVQLCRGELALEHVTRVDIQLLKHGAYYHPARIIVETERQQSLALVLNVAVSEQGRSTLAREVECLHRLNDELDRSLWPRVLGQGAGKAPDGRCLPMFLGNWFEGFCEFHLTAEGNAPPDTVVVWDPDRGHRMLTDRQTHQLLQGAAGILAYAYNPLTFDMIRRWHHAAGDFVVRADERRVDVRMITVREYSPFIEHADVDMRAVLDAVVAALMSISIRLRLDRRDGTGPPALFSDRVLPPVWAGFRQGLRRGVQRRGLPRDLFAAALDYIALHDGAQLEAIALEVVLRQVGDTMERDLLEGVLRDHAHGIAAVAEA